ncbi:MAG: serine hydrolase [Actinomycetota bacterium]
MTILDPPADLAPLARQPADVPWPTREWPTGPLPDRVDEAALTALLDRAFGAEPEPAFGESYATIVVCEGRIVSETYGPLTSPHTPLLSWSMAKSITQALAGILVDQGRLDPDVPAAVPEWTGDDPRSAITLRQMLRMTDGLDFNEAYAIPEDGGEAAWSHCIDMLFGSGTDDPAGYTADRPLRAEPGTVFNYSSGTSNLVARIVGDHIGRGETARAWMHEHLFGPIGMHSANPTFDTNGNFVGSSYLHATARDWARFGLLYQRGGEWDGRQIVSRDWVDAARAPRARDEDGGQYGEHWWTYPDGRGRFFCSGFEWQRVACVPSSDLVVVRLGKTAEDDYPTLVDWFDRLIALFD